MAISIRGSAGAWTESTSTTATITLPTHAAGDLLLVRCLRKPFTAPTDITCATAGWAASGTGFANGSTANGTGAGSMAVQTFWKFAASSSETSPVVTWGATAAPGATSAVVYQKATDENWVTPVGVGGVNATAATTVNDTLPSHVSCVSGDMLDFYCGWPDDSGTPATPSIAQAGVTFDTVAIAPTTPLDITTGTDMAAHGGYRLATAGTSSAAAIITAAYGSSEEHIVWATRLRVAAADNQLCTPDLVALTTALFAPTASVSENITVTIPTAGGGAGPTVAFTCGAECAALAHWSTLIGPVTRDTGTKRSGAASIKVAAAGASTCVYFTLGTPTHVVYRVAIYLDGLPGTDATLANIVGSPNNAVLAFDVATGKLCIAEQGNWAGRVLGPVLVNQTQTVIDIHADYSVGCPTISWKVDGTAQTTYTAGAAAGTYTGYRLGQAGSSGMPANTTYTAYYDDAVVSTTAADYPIADGYVAAGETWTPTGGGLVLTTFVPTVTVAVGNVVATPPAASLALTTFAPTVTATAHQLVTPGVASLVTAAFAPNVTLGFIVVPATASLGLSTFAPTVTASNHKLVTPGVAALTTALFAPTVTASAHKLVTPPAAALTLSAFAPTVTASNHQSVTPGIVALVLATFAPVVALSNNKTVTPDVVALNLSAFAPLVTATNHQTVTPGVAALTLATFAPTVTANAGLTVTPPTANLTLSGFAPTVTTSAHVTATPPAASLSLSAFVPTVATTAHRTVTPAPASLTLNAFAPTVTAAAGLTIVPAAASLTLTGFAPLVTTTAHQTVTPTAASLALTAFAPNVVATVGATPGSIAPWARSFVQSPSGTSHKSDP